MKSKKKNDIVHSCALQFVTNFTKSNLSESRILGISGYGGEEREIID